VLGERTATNGLKSLRGPRGKGAGLAAVDELPWAELRCRPGLAWPCDHYRPDADLVEFYGAETRVPVEAVKRNAERFPRDVVSPNRGTRVRVSRDSEMGRDSAVEPRRHPSVRKAAAAATLERHPVDRVSLSLPDIPVAWLASKWKRPDTVIAWDRCGEDPAPERGEHILSTLIRKTVSPQIAGCTRQQGSPRVS